MQRLQRRLFVMLVVGLFACSTSLSAATPPAEPVIDSLQTRAYQAIFFEPQHPDSAYDMIRLLPAFDFDPGTAARGFAGAAGNVLIDGQLPISKLDSLVDILKRLPASSVSRIDVIQGAAPGIDMHGHSSVANIIEYPAITAVTLNADVEASSNGRIGNTARVDYTHHEGASELDGSLYLFRHDGTLDSRGPKILNGDAGQLLVSTRTAIANPNVGATASGLMQEPGWGGLWHIKGSLTYGTIQTLESDTVLGPVTPRLDTVHSMFRTLQGELSADFSRTFGDGTGLTLIALQDLQRSSGHAFAIQSAIATTSENAGLQGESIFRATATRALFSSLTLEGGAEAVYNFLDAKNVLTVGGAPIPIPSADVHVAEIRGEPYGTLTWKPDPGLTVEIGAKIEFSRLSVTGDAVHSDTFQFLKPHLFVTWNPGPEDQLRATLERTASQLDFQDFVTSAALDTGVISAGNAKLVPERDWTLVASWEHKFWDAGAVVLTLRHQDLHLVIDEVPIGPFTAPGNIGSGYRNTVSVDFTVPLKNIGLDGAILKGTLNWLGSRVTDPTTRLRRTITSDQPFVSQVSLSDDLPSLDSTWRLTVTGGTTFSIFHVDEIQKYDFDTQVDFQWEYKPAPTWSLIAQVQNIFSRNEDRERTIFAGLRGASALAFIENRRLTDSTRLLITIRRDL